MRGVTRISPGSAAVDTIVDLPVASIRSPTFVTVHNYERSGTLSDSRRIEQSDRRQRRARDQNRPNRRGRTVADVARARTQADAEPVDRHSVLQLASSTRTLSRFGT